MDKQHTEISSRVFGDLDTAARSFYIHNLKISTYPTFLNDVFTVLYDGYRGDKTVESLARDAGFSESTLRRILSRKKVLSHDDFVCLYDALLGYAEGELSLSKKLEDAIKSVELRGWKARDAEKAVLRLPSTPIKREMAIDEMLTASKNGAYEEYLKDEDERIYQEEDIEYHRILAIVEQIPDTQRSRVLRLLPVLDKMKADHFSYLMLYPALNEKGRQLFQELVKTELSGIENNDAKDDVIEVVENDILSDKVTDDRAISSEDLVAELFKTHWGTEAEIQFVIVCYAMTPSDWEAFIQFHRVLRRYETLPLSEDGSISASNALINFLYLLCDLPSQQAENSNVDHDFMILQEIIARRFGVKSYIDTTTGGLQ